MVSPPKLPSAASAPVDVMAANVKTGSDEAGMGWGRYVGKHDRMTAVPPPRARSHPVVFCISGLPARTRQADVVEVVTSDPYLCQECDISQEPVGDKQESNFPQAPKIGVRPKKMPRGRRSPSARVSPATSRELPPPSVPSATSRELPLRAHPGLAAALFRQAGLLPVGRLPERPGTPFGRPVAREAVQQEAGPPSARPSLQRVPLDRRFSSPLRVRPSTSATRIIWLERRFFSPPAERSRSPVR